MQTIQSIPIEDIDGSTLRLLALENAQRGSSKTICNMYLAMAASPRALEGYAEFRHALAGGKLSPRLREQIALVVAQANHCDYSLAQHVSDAVDLGMNTEEIQNARRARANDAKTLAALQVARDLVSRSAEGPQAARSLRDVGYSDSEIVEIIAQVSLNLFESYFNAIVQTDIDFPRVALESRAAA